METPHGNRAPYKRGVPIVLLSTNCFYKYINILQQSFFPIHQSKTNSVQPRMELSWHEQLNMVGSAIQQIIRPNHSGSAPRCSTVSESSQIVRVQRFNASVPITVQNRSRDDTYNILYHKHHATIDSQRVTNLLVHIEAQRFIQ